MVDISFILITFVLSFTYEKYNKSHTDTLPKLHPAEVDDLCDRCGYFIMKRIDLTGKRFGRLVVINYAYTKNNKSYYNCACDCGDSKTIVGYSLKNGNTTSCGCLHNEITGLINKSHGCASGGKTKEYRIWRNMKTRCLNKDNKSYPYYGGRGITICDRWVNSFPNFLEDMGVSPFKGASIDRIDNNGNYEPCNCRWATRIEQNNNQRTNVRIAYNDEIKTISQWAKIYNIKYATLRKRLFVYGLTIDQAINKINHVKVCQER